jgi:hypothetical protein
MPVLLVVFASFQTGELSRPHPLLSSTHAAIEKVIKIRRRCLIPARYAPVGRHEFTTFTSPHLAQLLYVLFAMVASTIPVAIFGAHFMAHVVPVWTPNQFSQ